MAVISKLGWAGRSAEELAVERGCVPLLWLVARRCKSVAERVGVRGKSEEASRLAPGRRRRGGGSDLSLSVSEGNVRRRLDYLQAPASYEQSTASSERGEARSRGASALRRRTAGEKAAPGQFRRSSGSTATARDAPSLN